ncbi:hypothetical protein Bpfe_022291 [Biomphalaria pfeifferi]|uniref:Uncharacterized protein n=1 Tax=Biomphalaria pfeifferi TaxID=112525 RepID=A0AAD8F357_BIOPF|nr:hypothetical protein Bpfe_022291 [Biomphalaria pfeifferi]
MATERKPFCDVGNVLMNRDVTGKRPTDNALISVNAILERDQDIEQPSVSTEEAFEPGTSEVNLELSGNRPEAKKRISRRPNLGRSRILYIVRCKTCRKIYTGETLCTLAIQRSRLIREVQRGISQRRVAMHFRTALCGVHDMEFIEKKQIGHTDRRINQKRKMI